MPCPAFLSHPIFLASGFGRHHPLSIPRQSLVIGLAEALGWLDRADIEPCPLPDIGVLARLHEPAYLEALETAARAGVASREARERYNLGTMECPIFPGLWDRARATVGGSIRAAELAMSGRTAFHPAGGTHHGMTARASGFCYFNDPAFAVLSFLDLGAARVAYIDIDAHHGDGVEAMFAPDPRVMTLSIHEEGRWPGTGRLGDRARGRAHNMPVPRDISDSEFLYLIDEAVLPLAETFAPGAVVVTCGVDTLAGDPLSGMALSNTAVWDAVDRIACLGRPTVILGGGGYNPWTLARAWTGVWGRLCGEGTAIALPEAARALLAPLSVDLVEPEDIDPRWLSRLEDTPHPGPIRDPIRHIAEKMRAPSQ
ncbi:MAG TPA: acetoin utilization protein AcuC [Hyphomicrobiaceae bacterium]|nr:acetoin utilization protein AcuC [Hyphomicrobiaceae bacterium]